MKFTIHQIYATYKKQDEIYVKKIAVIKRPQRVIDL